MMAEPCTSERGVVAPHPPAGTFSPQAGRRANVADGGSSFSPVYGEKVPEGRMRGRLFSPVEHFDTRDFPGLPLFTQSLCLPLPNTLKGYCDEDHLP
jgi:hypothetical protein